MKITTSKGHEYAGGWAFAPAGKAGRMMLEMEDARALSLIAAEIEGCAEINTQRAQDEPVTVYAGYTRLTQIARAEDGSVRITLERE